MIAFTRFQQARARAALLELTVVALTGIVGRYLKSLTPRPVVARLDCNLRALDAISSGLGEDIRGLLRLLPPTDIGAAPSFMRCLRTLPAWRNDIVLRRRAIDEAVATAFTFDQHNPRSQHNLARADRRDHALGRR